MKKTILIIFCVCGLGIQSIYQPVIAQSKNLSTLSELNPIKISGNYSIAKTSKIDSIIDFGKTFLNKPYRFQGSSSFEMDCSGYISFIFAEFGYQIPHSSISLGSIVENIDQNEIKKGDLLFFKGRNIKSNSIGHVSLVIETSNGSIKMMHSCQRGIIIEEYQKTDYYKQRFIKAGRLPFIFETKLFDTLDTAQVASMPIRNFSNKDDSISIIGVGDMMLGTNFPSKSYLPPDDGKNILSYIDENPTFNDDIFINGLANIIFHTITNKTLLIWGRVDSITPPFVAEKFHQLMPNSELAWIEGCGHAPMMAYPKEFTEAMLPFLDKVYAP